MLKRIGPGKMLLAEGRCALMNDGANQDWSILR